MFMIFSFSLLSPNYLDFRTSCPSPNIGSIQLLGSTVLIFLTTVIIFIFLVTHKYIKNYINGIYI